MKEPKVKGAPTIDRKTGRTVVKFPPVKRIDYQTRKRNEQVEVLKRIELKMDIMFMVMVAIGGLMVIALVTG